MNGNAPNLTTWEDNPQYLSQAGHFLGGTSVMLTAALFSMALDAGWDPILITFGAGTVVAAFKEFYLDLRKPEDDTLPDSLMDFSFYVLGGTVGLGLAALAMSYRSTPNPSGTPPARSALHRGRKTRSASMARRRRSTRSPR